jgi:hypothetical protein
MLLQLFTVVQFHVTRLHKRHVKLLCGFDMLDMLKDHLSGKVVLCRWISNQALTICINSKCFLTVVSKFWKFFSSWLPSHLKVVLIKMGPSNEDIWILELSILEFWNLALNNGNVFGQW